MTKDRAGPIERHQFQDDGLVPNNPTLPLTVYRRAIDADHRSEDGIIRHLAANGWSNAWVNGIFDYHHFHTTVHEVLVIAREWLVQFGGPSGKAVEVSAGDAVLIPAGVGHCRLAASPDLSVVGAYPGGADYDLVRATPEACVRARPLVAAVPPPARDPITGERP